jgi:hypothetical protein
MRKSLLAKSTPVEPIDRRILLMRGQRVMLDADLAELYGVPTKVLNQAVKRNRERFPRDFMFRLTREEREEVVTNCDHLHRLKFSPTLPYTFTEHGAVMLANVLNSRRAVQVSIQVVRVFVRLRQTLAVHRELAEKLAELERRLEGHDRQIRSIFDAIRQLMPPPHSSRRRIGFHPRVGS